MAKSYDYFYLYQEQPKQELPKSIMTSVIIHGLLAIAILTVVVPEIKTPAQEIVIEVLEHGSPATTSASMMVPMTAPMIAPQKSDKDEVPALRRPKAKTQKATNQAKNAKSLPAAKTVVRATLDDIETPTLDESDIVMNKQNHKLADKDLDSTFESVDQENSKMLSKKLSDAEKSLTAAEKNMDSEFNSELDDVQADNQRFSEQMDQSLGHMKSTNASRLAALKQGELKAAQEAAALKAARDSRYSSAGQGGIGQAATGSGQGKNPSGIRSLQELKQQPGNPMPSYSLDERFRREQGTVVFQAFVTAQGQLTQFRLLQSTGYQNLDAKTLAVLKKWKFYPGQQGWVEIPQVWSLKGEEQELPAALRRKQLSKN